MIFHSNFNTANECFKKYRRSGLISTALMMFFLFLEIAYRYHKDRLSLFSLFYTAVCLVLFYLILKTIYNGEIVINKTVDKIEINTSQIFFKTFESSFLFHLNKKNPQEISAERSLIQFSLSTTKYGLDKKLTGDIYHLTYAGDEYLVAENFFDNFPELKACLEN